MEAAKIANYIAGPDLPPSQVDPVFRVDGTSEDLGDFALALSKAQGRFSSAKKDRVNPHFKSKYADLASVFDACREQLSVHEIAVVQQPAKAEKGWVAIATWLIHKSGQWMRGTCEMPVPQNTPQAYGSAYTYARRYGLSCMAGIAADDDDDGNVASGRSAQAEARQGPPTAASPQPLVEATKARIWKQPEAVAQALELQAPTAAVQPATPPPSPAQLRARIGRVWKAMEKGGATKESFPKWVAEVIKSDKASSDLNEAEVALLEEEVATLAAHGG